MKQLGVTWITALMASIPLSAAAATQSGVLTQACTMHWQASAVLDKDLSNDDPNYPGLATEESYSNNGFIQSVMLGSGSPGLLQVEHFYTNAGTNTSNSNTAMNWRVPFATAYRAQNVTITVTLPDSALAALDFSFADSEQPWFNNRGDLNEAPGPFTWSVPANSQAINQGDGSWMITIPEMPAGAAYGFSLRSAMPAGIDLTDQFVATIQVTGQYEAGSPACVTVPPAAHVAAVPTTDLAALLALSGLLAGVGAVAARRRSFTRKD